MRTPYEIRSGTADDLPQIEGLYREAFPEEDLLPLVRDLVRQEAGVYAFVGMHASSLIGHVAFTPCRIEGQSCAAVLAGPLAVAPAWQRQGLGSALLRHGLDRLAAAGPAVVFVLGDPAFYGRLGFARDETVAPPYPLVDDWRPAWQSLWLGAGPRRCTGKLQAPAPWQRPALWAP